MVKVIQSDVPPEFEELWAKCIRWFGRYGVPTYVRMWFQTARRNYNQRVSQSKFDLVKVDWKTLDDAIKYQWKLAAYRAYGYYRAYRLFTADWIWRDKVGLSNPGAPHLLHQLFGLEMLNPGGSENVQMRRDDKDLIGRLRIRFNFKKIENAASPPAAFKMLATAYYLTDGGIATETDSYTCPAGNIDWTEIDRRFGTTDRKYFHFKLIFVIDNYDAEVYFDNIRLADNGGEYYADRFNTKDYVPWVPILKWRKKDWVFSPSFIDTFFKHLYLE